jgi:hypothetical protein
MNQSFDYSKEFCYTLLMEELMNSITNIIFHNTTETKGNHSFRMKKSKNKSTRFLMLQLSGICNQSPQFIFPDPANNIEFSQLHSDFKMDKINMTPNAIQSLETEIRAVITFTWSNYQQIATSNATSVEYSAATLHQSVAKSGDTRIDGGGLMKPIYIPPALWNKINSTFKPANANLQLLPVLVILHRRYTLLFGPDIYGISLSAEFLYEVMDPYRPTLEMYASFFNRHLSNYCSLFYDLEKHFGSLGSANCLAAEEFIERQYIAINPPYDEEMMVKMTNVMDRVFTRATELKKQVIGYVTIPDWSPPYQTYNKLKPHAVYNRSVNVSKLVYKNWLRYQNVKLQTANTRIMIISNKKKIPEGILEYFRGLEK